MLESFLGKVSGLEAKSFVASGILPAAVLVFVPVAYFAGFDLLAAQAGAFIKTPKETAAGVLWMLLAWLLLSALFFASRGVISWLWQDVPFSWLRSRLVRRQERKRDSIEAEFKRAQARATAFFWIEEESPNAPTYGADLYADPAKQAQTSAEALAAVRQLAASSQEIGWRGEQRFADGIEAAYARAVLAPKEPWGSDRSAWQTALKTPHLKALLSRLKAHAQAEIARCYLDLSQRFPSADWTRPTEMGNRMETLQDYAEKRYGIETSALWARLWWVLKPEERESVAYSKLAVECLFNLAAAFALCALIVAASAIWHSVVVLRSVPFEKTIIEWKSISFVIGCGMLALMFYRGASPAITALCEKIIGLVDVRRFSLLRELGFRPATLNEELELWADLKRFYVQGLAMPSRALHLDNKAEKGDNYS